MAQLQGSGAGTNAGGIGFPSTNRHATIQNFTTLVNFGDSALLPDVYEKKVKRFGNRSISGLLSKMAAEYALANDMVQWTEDERLHIKATGVARAAAQGPTAKNFTFPQNHSFRVGQTVMIVNTTNGNEAKGLISSVSGTGNEDVVIESYHPTTGTGATSDGGFGTGTYNLGTASNLTVIAYGSEFSKGTPGMTGTLETRYVNRSNQPIILKDKFAINGSDIAQLGWIEVSDVNGDGGHGYLWYLQSELDERARFMDYVETSLIEAIPAAADSQAAALSSDTLGSNIRGTRGLFYELEQYGSTFTDGFNDTTGGTTAAQLLSNFDNILKQLDTQGNIEENTFYLNRDESLAFDNLLGNQSDFGGAGGGPSWGSFTNGKDMALNLGFSGVRRGSYDFYKTDWKYLNDSQARRDFSNGTNANVQGIMVPMGSSSVYDEMLSKTVTRPYMHIRYRAAGMENRKLKTFITGSVGGNVTSDLDAMEVHYLSERCLIVQAANNFAIFKNQ